MKKMDTSVENQGFDIARDVEMYCLDELYFVVRCHVNLLKLVERQDADLLRCYTKLVDAILYRYVQLAEAKGLCFGAHADESIAIFAELQRLDVL